MTNILSTRALLVRPSISLWRGEVTDRAASRETADRNSADARLVKTSKFLIAKEAIEPIVGEANSLRSFVRAETLPWRWDGVSLLPTDNYFPFMEGWRAGTGRMNSAVDRLLRQWGVHVREGQRRLGSLANEFDYPTAAQVRLSFNASLECFPVPDAADFRASLSEAEAEAIREQIELAGQAQLAEAQSFLWQQMTECVEHIVDRLSAYGRDEASGKIVGRFHDTLIGNLRQLVDRLARLNVTGDPNIEAMRVRLTNSLCPYEPDELRSNDELRSSVRDEAKRIMLDMSAIYGGAAIAAE